VRDPQLQRKRTLYAAMYSGLVLEIRGLLGSRCGPRCRSHVDGKVSRTVPRVGSVAKAAGNSGSLG
jgi:hypothetical protein